MLVPDFAAPRVCGDDFLLVRTLATVLMELHIHHLAA
jgi:hypothetical protein